jgi:predicted ribosome quality control (RQC) complex YloA/Tae2 family protein
MKNLTIFDSLLKKDFEIIVGISAKENWDIIDDSCQNDIWFHLEDLPSCHVILKTLNIKLKEFNKQTFIHCASICKENSKYKSHKNIEVIFTLVKNLKKTEPVGSVIATNTKSIYL